MIRWLDDALEDLRSMDVRGDIEMAKYRRHWIIYIQHSVHIK